MHKNKYLQTRVTAILIWKEVKVLLEMAGDHDWSKKKNAIHHWNELFFN